MVLQWGVSEKLGPVAYSEEEGTVFLGEELGAGREYSEDTARQVDEEIRKILNEAYQRAADTLTEYREGLDKVADALVENEEIPGERVLKIVGMREKLERQEAETFELGSASAGAGAEEAPQPA
jgi:cell division protease FtsH